MSSGESRTTTSSRLSQFGLYRSMDARTEEFLRLSRKRQIRQGCACAAVSTAITVTVVVTVLLVYENTVSTEPNLEQKTNRKPYWFGLFNDSASFDNKYNKAKLNIDPTTLKLLPIILKALNHNRYLEKLIEDSSSSPVYERKDTTEFAYKKNVFSDSKNWMKNPHSKTYEIEYKTSPIAYFKLPSNNLDYYRKIRKIRDYQRVLNYFDKMINEKVKYGTTQPDIKDARTEKPKKKVVPVITFQQSIPQKLNKPSDPIHTSKTQMKKSEPCTCSKKLSLFISKLLTSIQEFIPEIMIAKIPCNNSEHKKKDKTIYVTTKTPILSTTRSYILSTTPKTTTVTKKLLTTTEKVKTTKYTTHIKKFAVKKSLEQDSNEIEDNTVELEFIKKFYNSYRAPTTTINKAYLDATKAELIKATKPMRKVKKNKIVNQPNNKKFISKEDKTTESYNIQILKRTDLKNQRYYKDYDTTTTESDNSSRNAISFQSLEQHNTEQIHKIKERKQIIWQRKPSSSKIVYVTKHLNLHKNISLTSPSPTVKINYRTTLKATTIPPTAEPFTAEPFTAEPFTAQPFTAQPFTAEPFTAQPFTAEPFTAKPFTAQPFTAEPFTAQPFTAESFTAVPFTAEPFTTTRRVYIGKGLTSTEIGKDRITTPSRNTTTTTELHKFFNDEENKPPETDFQEEEIMKQIDHAIKPTIQSKKFKKDNYESVQEGPVTIKTTESSGMMQLYNEIIEPGLLKSMLPISRPIYLEINRNDFNHDTTNDYNANVMDQNIFDLY